MKQSPIQTLSFGQINTNLIQYIQVTSSRISSLSGEEQQSDKLCQNKTEAAKSSKNKSNTMWSPSSLCSSCAELHRKHLIQCSQRQATSVCWSIIHRSETVFQCRFLKTRICCTYPDLESWEGLWSLVNNAWEPHFESPPPFMHFLRKNTLQRERGG